MSVVQSFDALGRLDSEIKVFADGRYSLIDYDQAGEGAWSLSSRTYDVFHRLIEDAVVFDSGAASFVYYDAAAAYPWYRQTVGYDAAGLVESVYVELDSNGSPYDVGERRSTFDRRDAHPWAEVHSSFEWRGLTAMREEVLYDDGSRYIYDYRERGILTFQESTTLHGSRGEIDFQTSRTSVYGFAYPTETIDYDLANEFPWTFVSTATARNGALISATTLYDTGALDVSRRDGSFNLNHLSYDPLGRLTRSSVERLDGSTGRTEYDIAGLAPWRAVSVGRDAQGRQTSYEAVLDDGAQDWSYYDVNDVQPWSAASSHRNAGSNRVDWTALMDDGTVISGFDLV